ncbi:hypothetical protein FDECE_779 [Fusarium decemcellulare]|nr:hypothetical protein FDECE_779 [Fusarium decemcellulare]
MLFKSLSEPRQSNTVMKFYAVAVGRQTGIFDTWEETKAQVNRHSGALHKSFGSRQEAEDYLSQNMPHDERPADEVDSENESDTRLTEATLRDPQGLTDIKVEDSDRPQTSNALDTGKKWHGRRSHKRPTRRNKATVRNNAIDQFTVSGVLCQVSQRGVRGPKKGYIKALKDRLVNLEAQLSDRLSTQQRQLQTADTGGGFDITLPTPPTRVSNEHQANASQEILSFAPGADAALSPSTLLDPPRWTPMLCSTPNTDLYITDIMHAELDQLYLDRVHPSIPILHQRRYLSWSKLHSKTPTRTCLQYVMWTLATLLSVQFRDMTEPLYQKVKQMLESLSIESNGRRSCDTELVQAWVLIATCESMRTYHQAAWMSAGRAFRLIQAMRFHEIDTPGNKNDPSLSNDDDFIETEEKRRVFWMAYLLDHLLGIRSDWPITLNEHVVCTRLPAPDSKFQSSQHVLGSFLSEAMTESSSGAYSPFNECLILVTLCGRSLLRDQQNKISKAYGDIGSDQQQWLDDLLKTRLEKLSLRYPSFTEANDPLLLFANILGQFAVVYYCKGIIEAATRLPDSMEASTQVVEAQNRALQATGVIIQLARAMQDLHFSKASQGST